MTRMPRNLIALMVWNYLAPFYPWINEPGAGAGLSRVSSLLCCQNAAHGWKPDLQPAGDLGFTDAITEGLGRALSS
jgi:hypothetical protein